MKKIVFFLCIVVFLFGLFDIAIADIGRLEFSSLTQGTIENSNILQKREYDPTGNIYPYTGLANGTREHTVMLYLVGADLESGGNGTTGGNATKDLKEIINSGYNQNLITVLIMAGGSTKWFNNAVDVEDTAIYEVVDDSLVKRSTNGLVGMGKPETLNDFVNFGYDNFPAQNYSLILWDHGGGPLGGLLYDYVSIDYFPSVKNVCDALEQTQIVKDKLYILGFDACLEGSVEIANLIAPYAHQLVVSEENEPGEGWNYKFLKGLENDENPTATASRIIDSYFEQYDTENKKVTLSSICLDNMSELIKKSNAFFDEINEKLNAESFVEFAALRQKLEPVSMNNTKLDLVDLLEMVETYSKYAPSNAEDLINSIHDTIKYEKHNIGISSGLSIYFPYFDSKNYFKNYASNYKNLKYDNGYSNFIDGFNNIQRNSPDIDWNISNQEGVRDTHTNFSLILSSEQISNLAESTLVILRQIEGSNLYVVVKPDGATELVNGQLIGDYVHNALYIVDGNGGLCNEQPLVWSRDAAGHYVIPATIITGNKYIDVQIICDVNGQTNQFTILYILLKEEGSDFFTNRAELNLEECDLIQFKVPVYKETSDSNGVLTGVFDWEIERVETYTYDVHGDWTLSMEQDTIARDELYAAFVLTDFYRMTHTSPLISISGNNVNQPTFVLTYDDDFLTISNTISTNNDDVYILFTVSNPTIINAEKNQNEVFIHFDNVKINDATVDAELWLEADGPNDGIPVGESTTDTLVLRGLGKDGLGSIHDITFNITVVNAANEEEIASQQATGYLSLPNQ